MRALRSNLVYLIIFHDIQGPWFFQGQMSKELYLYKKRTMHVHVNPVILLMRLPRPVAILRQATQVSCTVINGHQRYSIGQVYACSLLLAPEPWECPMPHGLMIHETPGVSPPHKSRLRSRLHVVCPSAPIRRWNTRRHRGRRPRETLKHP